jgi:membrane glycosyltransferase
MSSITIGGTLSIVIGALVLAFVIVVVIPVGFLMSMAVVSAIFGFALKTNAEAEADGSELIDLNR